MASLITICARGGSKGIPGKNIKLLNDQPLIFYSIQTAIAFAHINKSTHIILSTDSDDIRNIVKQQNFEGIESDYIRPDNLASDTAGKIDVIYDAKNFMEEKTGVVYDHVIDLDVTSPLRSVEDLEKAFAILNNNEHASNIFSVSPANRNPYFNMVQQAENGFYQLCKKGDFLTRQSAPSIYDMNASFYIYRASFFKDGEKKAITDRSLVYVVPHMCFDLDHPIDFEFMTYLMENNKLDFDLFA